MINHFGVFSIVIAYGPDASELDFIQEGPLLT